MSAKARICDEVDPQVLTTLFARPDLPWTRTHTFASVFDISIPAHRA